MATGLQNAGRVCYATLLTTDTYLHGALTLAASLRETGTQNEIVCLVADSQLSRPALERLETMFDRIISIPMLDTNDVANLSLLGRPDLGTTVTKIGVWSLTEYRRIVFLDADTLVFQSLDSLLELDLKKTFENSNMTIGDDIRPNGGMANRGLLAAAPDLGWPDCFNSGVFVATPSKSTHAGLLQLLSTRGSFDGGDQGLLNEYFSDWSRADSARRLPFAYNTASTSFYTYAPAFAHFSHSIKVVHFVGPQKPWKWQHGHDGTLHVTTTSSFAPFVDKWWKVHDRHVSLWTSEMGVYNRETALSPSKRFSHKHPSISDVGNECSKPDAVYSETRSSSPPLSSHIPHSTDKAWKKEGCDYAAIEGRSDDDNWVTFTPAPDFVLDSSPNPN
ncbi:glycogenin glucosyltransferase [Coemansia sp. RSA 986]|nr:glycogenin glucosyltransferase [Coemansia sp. RSA 986]